MDESWALTDDLSSIAVWGAVLLALAALGMLLVELRRQQRGAGAIFTTGALAVLFFMVAVLRPVQVQSKSTQVGARVTVLFDGSRRLLLEAGDETRRARGLNALTRLREHLQGSRLDVSSFGEGGLEAFDADQRYGFSATSDLIGALGALAARPGERPAAIVVLSDGRLTRPAADPSVEAIRRSLGNLDVPIHGVALADADPADASIRSVRAAGAAVAHQPLTLEIEVGCVGLSCGEIPVSVRELRDGVAAAQLADASVEIRDGVATVQLEITLDRAGARVVEVAIQSPTGDEIPENDKRLLTFRVARDRIRLLHLAGRPTYDVRALRRWLKGDDAVDTVAFFILRGDTDDPGASESELALIRFPVDELFTEHLPSFDAVILQDIDAIRYKLARYLERLTRYVKTGGGLIMVGGPSSFAGGNYAGTPLDEIMPVEQPRDEKGFDSAEFVPRYTEAGRVASVTHALRGLLDERLPPMPGANLLGRPRSNAIVLLEHPSLAVGGQPMPVLALGEAGDGRAIALGLDATARFAFGELAAEVAGRAYGSLWDGLLGWLMRDPRYEAARVDVVGECIAGEPLKLRVTRLPGMGGSVKVELRPLSEGVGQSKTRVVEGDESGTTELEFEPLEQGGYTAKVSIGAAPPTRLDFGCEAGGSAWGDSRTDAPRLERVAEATGGAFVSYDDVEAIPTPRAQEVSAERRVAPIAPPWAWTLVASVMLGAHWISRRFGGLS